MLSREQTRSMSKQKNSFRVALVLQMTQCLPERARVRHVAGGMLEPTELCQGRCPSDIESLLSRVSLRSSQTLLGAVITDLRICTSRRRMCRTCAVTIVLVLPKTTWYLPCSDSLRARCAHCPRKRSHRCLELSPSLKRVAESCAPLALALLGLYC